MLLREGRATSSGRTASYGPFIQILRQDAGINDGDTESEGWQKLESRVRQLFPGEAEDLLPPLGTLGRLHRPPGAGRKRPLRRRQRDETAPLRRGSAVRPALDRRAADGVGVRGLALGGHVFERTASRMSSPSSSPPLCSSPWPLATSPNRRPHSCLTLVRRDHPQRLVEVPLEPLDEDDTRPAWPRACSARPSSHPICVPWSSGRPMGIRSSSRSSSRCSSMSAQWSGMSRSGSWRATKELHRGGNSRHAPRLDPCPHRSTRGRCAPRC